MKTQNHFCGFWLRHIAKVLPAALILLIFAAWTANAEDRQELRLSIASIGADPSETVAGFYLNIKGALVVSFPRVPAGWTIRIDNDPSWNAEISGVAIVGAANLPSDEFRSDFLVIRRMPNSMQKYPGASQETRITGYIVLYKTDQSRRIELSNQDFVLIH